MLPHDLNPRPQDHFVLSKSCVKIPIPTLQIHGINRFIYLTLLPNVVQPSGCDIKQTLKYTEKISMVPVQGWHA